ncbi:MAG: DUF58 domain-containing protein [Planctomycetes bacterium]|nr:DUF58 domain-containing protein [Planctomycetota bacterium]
MWRLRLGPPRGGGGRPGASITRSGFVYFHALVLITLAALNASVNLLFLVIGLGIGIALIGVVVANAAMRRLRLTREAPDAVLAGRPFTIRYRVTNQRTRTAAFALRIRETVLYGNERLHVEGYIETVPAGETVTLDVSMTVPVRGGLHFKSARLSTRFPFGLFERRLTVVAEHQTLVFPALFPVRRTLKGRQALAAAQSLSAREQKQGQDEFYGLREYRHGDNPKRIHWRSTARTGQLLMREMVDLKPQSIIVILDTYLPPGAEESLRERAISAAATVLCHALEQGYRLALIVNSANPVVIPPTSGRGLRSKMMTHLVQIEGRTPRPAARFLQGLRWRGNWLG